MENVQGISENVPVKFLGTRFKEPIALVNMVSRSLTGTFF
jgi:hypothetical protein